MLSDLMEARGLTRYSLAQQAGVSPRSLGKWMAKMSTPTVTSAVKVARVFGVDDGAALLADWGYDAVDLGALDDPSPEVLDLILAEVQTTNRLLRRLDGLLRHTNREQGEQPVTACCDPPCRLMQIQALSRDELVEVLVNAEEELDMARAHIADTKGEQPNE